MKLWLIKPILLLFLVLISLITLGCSNVQTDEVLIQLKIDQLQNAIEKHHRGDFMAIIDRSYHDQMNHDRHSLQRFLMGFFLRYKDISVYISATKINNKGIRAIAESQIVLTGGETLIPESARHYQVYSCWSKVEEEWLLTCLEWQ
jgi:hypothetical protein